MNCDLCGKEERLYKTDVDSAVLNVCNNCSKYGRIISEVKPKIQEPKKTIKKIIQTGPEKELIQVIVEDYAQRIKQKREQLGIKQEDFAKRINEKVSLLHQIETGRFEPNMPLARKLEKTLKIRLIDQHEEVHSSKSKEKSDSFTIGDFIKTK